jgi:hypothetical protein
LYAAFYETTVEALWPGGTVDGAGALGTRNGDVKRREFTRLAGGIVTGLAGGQLLADSDPQAAAAEARTITSRYRRDDERVASSELLGPVLRHLDALVRQLRGDHPRHPALGAAASEAAGFVGWLWFDMDSPGAARARYKQAIRHAEQAGNPTLRAYMIGSLSALASYAGDGAAAVRLAKDASRGLGVDPPAVSRAWLAASEAVAYATARDERACMVALERAEAASDAAGQGQPSWPWIFAFDRAKVAAYRGSCLVRLGRPFPARSALLSALAARKAPTKQNALLLIDLAHTHVQRGDQDEGCRLLGGLRRRCGQAVREGRPSRAGGAAGPQSTGGGHPPARPATPCLVAMTRIGGTGHQGLPPETVRLVDHALREYLAGQEARDLLGVTMLGPGADQLFAEAVLDVGGLLHVVIPAVKYRDGFEDQDAKRRYDALLDKATYSERLEHVESTEEAHMAGGRAVVDAADVVVAIWDGQPARGLGGTADVVAYARKRGVPVEVIWPAGAARD